MIDYTNLTVDQQQARDDTRRIMQEQIDSLQDEMRATESESDFLKASVNDLIFALKTAVTKLATIEAACGTTFERRSFQVILEKYKPYG